MTVLAQMPPPEPNNALVEMLQDLLAEAQAGQLRSAAVVVVRRGLDAFDDFAIEDGQYTVILGQLCGLRADLEDLIRGVA